MIQVVAFEGLWPAGVGIALGAAALQSGDVITNSVTGHVTSYETFKNADRDVYTELPSPLELSRDYAGTPVLVFGVDVGNPIANFFRPAGKAITGYAGVRRTGNLRFYVFDEDARLQRHFRESANKLFTFLAGSPNVASDRALGLLRDALVVLPRHPGLHALRVTYSPSEEQEWAQMFAEASITTIEDLAIFRELCTGFDGKPRWATLHYDGGVATGGGLPLKNMSQVCESLAFIEKKVQPFVRAQVRYYENDVELPEERLTRLEAASAHLIFDVVNKGSTPIERFTRHVSLNLLSRLLSNDAPLEFDRDPETTRHLELIARPAEGTHLKQRRVGADEDEDVYLEEVEQERFEPDCEFSVVGFIVHHTERRIHVQIGGSRERHWLSTTKNGRGGAPEGVGIFQDTNDFPYRPIAFNLQLHLSETSGRWKLFLLSLNVLHKDESTAYNSIASTVVPGAIVVFPAWRHVRLNQLPTSLAAAESWLDEVRADQRDTEYEYAGTGIARIILPFAWRVTTTVHRCVIVLGEAGVPQRFGEIAERLNEAFEGWTKARNFWSDVRGHQRWISVNEGGPADSDDETFELTSEGWQAYRLLAEALRQRDDDIR